MLCPVNKYLVVRPIREKKTQDTTILLPDNVDVNKSPHTVVEVVTPHIASNYDKGARLLVPSHSVEEVSFLGETYHIILEHHVIGFLL